MKILKLKNDDYSLFHNELTFDNYNFLIVHKDCFEHMFNEQGPEFWLKFLLTFRSSMIKYHSLHITDFNCKQIQVLIPALLDETYIIIHRKFIIANFKSAKELCQDVKTVHNTTYSFQFLLSESVVRNPFFSPTKRYAFRNLFGEPECNGNSLCSKINSLKVMLQSDILFKFVASISELLQRWMNTNEASHNVDEKYWSIPSEFLHEDYEPFILETYLGFQSKDLLEKLFARSLRLDWLKAICFHEFNYFPSQYTVKKYFEYMFELESLEKKKKKKSTKTRKIKELNTDSETGSEYILDIDRQQNKDEKKGLFLQEELLNEATDIVDNISLQTNCSFKEEDEEEEESILKKDGRICNTEYVDSSTNTDIAFNQDLKMSAKNISTSTISVKTKTKYTSTTVDEIISLIEKEDGKVIDAAIDMWKAGINGEISSDMSISEPVLNNKIIFEDSKFNLKNTFTMNQSNDCNNERGSIKKFSNEKEKMLLPKSLKPNPDIKMDVVNSKTKKYGLEHISKLKNLKICANCLKEEDCPKLFKKCQRCKDEKFPKHYYYCSKECQIEDWHNIHCKEHNQYLD